jgi:hypothetical protein
MHTVDRGQVNAFGFQREDMHSCGDTRSHSRSTVFDDGATLRRDAELLRDMQEQPGLGLPAADVVRAEHAAGEEPGQAGDRQRHLDLLPRGAGSDCHRHATRHRRHHPHRARDGPESIPKHGGKPGAIVGENDVLGQADAAGRFYLGEIFNEVAPPHMAGVEQLAADAALAEAVEEHRRAKRFAVDQRAVTVEYDGVDAGSHCGV